MKGGCVFLFSVCGGGLPATPPPALKVAGRPVELSLTAISAHTVRITVAPLDLYRTPQPVVEDPVLVPRLWPAPTLRLRSVLPAETVRVGGMEVTVNPETLSLRLARGNGSDFQEIGINPNDGSVSFRIGTELLFGLGEGGPQLDRHGLYAGNDLNGSPHDSMVFIDHLRVPLLIGGSGWAIFAHTPVGTFDLRGTEGRFRATESQPALPLDLFVMVADEPAALMTEYAGLTGFPSLPPLWALGYQQSHRVLLSEERMLAIARKLRDDKLPCDVLIYLGTGFAPLGWNLAHGSFEFNPAIFPNPRSDLEKLKSQNFRVVLHTMNPPARLFGHAGDPPSPDRDPNEAAVYWAQHQGVEKLGIDGWWPDGRVDSRRVQLYWDGPRADYPDQRPYTLFQDGFPGMQHYGNFIWSGDVHSDWDTLRMHIPVAINTGLSGLPYWGSDIGGFWMTKELTGELFVRWFQFGAFCPLFRSHGRPSQTRLPWGWNTGEIGPPEMESAPAFAVEPDPAELHNPDVEPICREYLELRYRMLPYIYSAARETHETGVPMMRALWLYYSDDPLAAARGDEYLWGRDILVAPVVEKGATSRTLYLPRGTWYDFWTGARVEGGREIARPVDLRTMPLYVRAGAVIPTGPVKQFTSEKVDGPLKLSIYPGSDGAFTIYDDDGTSFQFEKGEYAKIRGAWKDSTRELTLSLEKGSKLLPATPRAIEAQMIGGGTRQLRFDGKPLTVHF